MRKPLTAPVADERSTSRAPLASLNTDAVTPALAALIASRTCASVLAPGPIATLTLAAPVLAVKAPASQAPSWICRLPSPKTASGEA